VINTNTFYIVSIHGLDNGGGGLVGIGSVSVGGQIANIATQIGGGGAISGIAYVRITGTPINDITINFTGLASKMAIDVYTMVGNNSDTPVLTSTNSTLSSSSLTSFQKLPLWFNSG